MPSIVLGLLLVFRTNTAYERCWEGRILWGTLINTVRNLAREIWITIEECEPSDRLAKVATLRLLVAFAVAMKRHLRGERPDAELDRLILLLELRSRSVWFFSPMLPAVQQACKLKTGCLIAIQDRIAGLDFTIRPVTASCAVRKLRKHQRWVIVRSPSICSLELAVSA